MPDTLAQKVRAKFPGAYDDIDDATLEAKVTAKFPGVYDDIPKTTASAEPPAATPQAPAEERGWMDTASDLAIGAGKGALETIGSLGQMARKIPGVAALDNIVTPIDVDVEAKNTPQAIGKGAERIAEVLIPGRKITQAGAAVAGKVAPALSRVVGAKAASVIPRAAVEATGAGAISAAQGGDPTVGAVLGAAGPVVGAVAGKASKALSTSAQKSMAQALGATKEWAKSEAAKLAPEMLRRGVGGSREAMLATAKATAARVGGELNEAYRLAAEAGETIPTTVMQGNVQLAADALKVAGPDGIRRTIPGTKEVVAKLDELAEFIADMGDEIPVDKAAHIKRTWDQIVSKAGLFGPKATASATDNANAWAIREAAGSFRELLNSNAEIAALNKEAAFWTGLKNVLKETEKRTQAQRGGLTDAIRGGFGAAAGAASGGPIGALLGGVAMQQLSKAVASPWWKTQAAAPFKQKLADALASGNQGQALTTISRIGAVSASKVPAMAGQ